MSYQGGKQRLGKRIKDVICEIERRITGANKLPYFEPFVGLCGVMCQFAKERTCYACDTNADLIAMWHSLQKGWRPPDDVSKEEYESLKKTSITSPLRGFAGVFLSYNGIFFIGYRGTRKGENAALLGKRSLMSIYDDVRHVNFLDACEYDEHEPKNMLIYCDPPYAENKYKSKFFKDFDSERFWRVMRMWSKNNVVVISERIAPEDFIEVWSSEILLRQNKMINAHVEKLYVHSCLYKRYYKV